MHLVLVRYMFFLLFTGTALFVPVQSHAKAGAMTIALPADVIIRSLKDILPLDINNEPNKHLEGRLVLNSIDKLVMKDNSAVVQGMIIGKNISILTQVANQDLHVKVGNLFLPLTCDLFFRFDAKTKVLFVKPQLRVPEKGAVGDMANSVTTLLALVNNREFPVSLTSLNTFNAKIGRQDISVDMEPVDIRVSKGQVIVKMMPRLRKTN